MLKRPANMLWAIVGVFFSKIFPLASGLILVRIFGPESYGTYSLALATINLLLTCTGAGLVGGLIANLCSSTPREKRVSSFLALNIALLTATLLIAATAAALGWLDRRVVAVAITNWIPMVLLVVVQICLAAQSAVVTTVGALKHLAATSLLGGTVAAIGQLLGGEVSGVEGALWGMFVGYLGQLYLQMKVFGNHFGSPFSSVRGWNSVRAVIGGAWRDFLYYGKFMYASSVFVSVGMWWLSYWLLTRGGGFPDVAAFGVLNHWRMLAMFIPLALANYLTARFSLAAGRRMLALKGALVVIALAGLPFLLGSIAAPDHVLRIYGAAYAPLQSEIVLASLIAMLAGINSAFGNFLSGLHWFKEAFLSNLLWLTSLLGGMVVMESNGFSVLGACLSLLFAYICHSIYQVYLFCRIDELNSPKVG